jgi:hypothetical protein
VRLVNINKFTGEANKDVIERNARGVPLDGLQKKV